MKELKPCGVMRGYEDYHVFFRAEMLLLVEKLVKRKETASLKIFGFSGEG